MAGLSPKNLSSIAPQDVSAAIAQGRVSSNAAISSPPAPPVNSQSISRAQMQDAYKQYQVVSSQEFNALTAQLTTTQANALATLAANNKTGSIYGVKRKPWVFATFESLTNPNPTAASFNTLSQTGKSVIWTANPKSVSWTVNQRATETKNKSGTVLHVWRDRRRGTDFDDPKITIEFQSGNIMPQSTDATKVGSNAFSNPQIPTQIAGGLSNFYQFLQLVDQQKIYNGQANLIHILYSSYIFPSIVLSGFFDPQAVVQFTDDSNAPFQISGWRANFTIYKTTPRIDIFNSLVTAWNTEFGGMPGNTNMQPGPSSPHSL